jgi:hypothetical protein
VLLYLSPALKDGRSFGPADLGRGLSLLTRLPGNPQPYDNSNGDLVTQSGAWNLLDWHLVHAGHFPLWNDLSANGLPQFLNFESAVLSLPTLVGYLVPASLSFLVIVAVKMVIAGTGAYVCCRLLGTGPLAAAFGGTTAMLAGSFAGWLGWAVSGPEAWTGWLLAGVILAYRRRRPAGAVLLAVATAFAVYAGMPESDVLVSLGLGTVLGVTGLVCVVTRRRLDIAGIARVVAGIGAGAALSAPLWLAGLPVLAASARNGRKVATGLPLHTAVLLFAQGYDGLPIKGSYWFGPANYFETAAYLGIPTLVLALVGVASSWRRPPVAGLAAGVLAAFLVIYRLSPSGPVQRLLTDAGLGAVTLGRMQGVLEALVAVLAAIGLDAVLRRHDERAVSWSLLAGAALVLLVLADLWHHVGAAGVTAAIARADAAAKIPLPPHSLLSSLRRSSLYWPTAEAAAMLSAGVVIARSARRPASRSDRPARAGGADRSGPRWFGGLALVAESTFLLFAGVGINSYAPTAYPVAAPVNTLRQAVGAGLVGLDAANTSCPPGPVTALCGIRLWQGIGLYPATNLGYGIAELAAHDPVIPQRYFSAWPVPHSDQRGSALNLFVPSIDSVALADRYGVDYVLAGPGRPQPPGMQRVTVIAGMTLYRVPGAVRFGFQASDQVTGVTHPNDATYGLTVHAPSRSMLVMRITDTPGWHVTTGTGATLPVGPSAGGAFMSVEVPAGTTSLTVRYWPDRLSYGLLLAAGVAVALVAWSLAGALRPRRRSRAPAGSRGAAPAAGSVGG